MVWQRYLLLNIFIFVCGTANAQTAWKLLKDQQGIKVFSGSSPNSKYKSIKVICSLEGSLDKLVQVLTNVDHHSDWVYKTKSSKLVKADSPTNILYYSETLMPWPIENRDAVVRLTLDKTGMPQVLGVLAKSEPGALPKQDGKVRIPYSQAVWHVKRNGDHKIDVEYLFEVNPGGSMPAWIVNMFADKGPYESFKKLAELLKK